MTTFHRALLAMLFAAWLAMPSVGDEGGENASGGGVWILPCAAVIDESALEQGVVARSVLAGHQVNQGLCLQMASNMGSASAVLVSGLSGDVMPLPTSGAKIFLSKQLMQSLAATRTGAKIVVADSQQRGYVIEITVDASGSTVTLSVL
ncbi:MAG: hypothetical protein H6835_02510 [Planctomycetes bacterium]|nr:hypothetical protein [Planctomycetota bacterium]